MVAQKIRVLVVDDSALMRKKISEMINQSPDCEVIGVARDGYEALQIIQVLNPDVVTLDLQLPKMDGLTCLGYIMSEWPRAVIVLSAFTEEGSLAAMKALEYGAIDFVAKPGGVISPDIDKVQEELLNKIRLAVQIPRSKLKFLSFKRASHFKIYSPNSMNKLIVIGASTGGPSAITQILGAFPGNLSAAVLIIQHMPDYFIRSFAERLNQQSELQVEEAKNGAMIEAGKAFVAPAGFDTKIVKSTKNNDGPKLSLSENNSHNISPSIDTTFSSAAEIFREDLIGVILTGMGRDGTHGCLKVKEYGGRTIAEDESSCIVYGMPSAAIAAKAIDHVLPLHEIPQFILGELGKIS